MPDRQRRKRAHPSERPAASTSRPTRRPRPRKRQRPEQKQPQVDGYVDVTIRCGLTEDRVRMSVANYTNKLTMAWALDRQDVILRSSGDSSELQIILRGSQNGRLRIQLPNKAAKLPLVTVQTANELRREIAEKQQKADAATSSDSASGT